MKTFAISLFLSATSLVSAKHLSTEQQTPAPKVMPIWKHSESAGRMRGYQPFLEMPEVRSSEADRQRHAAAAGEGETQKHSKD